MNAADDPGSRILVIDDEEAARYGIFKALEREGHHVALASDGREALGQIHDFLPHVVISDVNMPNMDGIALLREIAALKAPPPVILITAHGSENLAVQGLRAGAYDYIAKPFEIDELRNAVRNALERQRLFEENRRYYEDLENTLLQLKRSQAERIQAEKMASLGRLVAGIAHEMNTPLGAVSSAVDTFGRAFSRLAHVCGNAALSEQESNQIRKLTEALSATLAVAQGGCNRIDTLVKSMRRFANLDQSPRRAARVTECLESTIALLSHELQGRIHVLTEFGEEQSIECYPMELNQLFTCLLLNSIEAIDATGRIQIQSWDESDRVVVRFVDTGRGISSENLNRVFEPGFTTKGAGVGTGLGLPTCRAIVDKHRGSMVLDSQAGSGTTVTVYLPLNGAT